MPCWERRSQTIDMAKVDPNVLADALRSLGAQGVEVREGHVHGRIAFASVDWSGGRLTVRGQSDRECAETANRVKKQYTKEAFKVAARRAGFSVEAKEDAKGRLLAQRRVY